MGGIGWANLDLVIEGLEVFGYRTTVDACAEQSGGEHKREKVVGNHFGMGMIGRFLIKMYE